MGRTVDVDNPYGYMVSLADAFGYAQAAIDRTKSKAANGPDKDLNIYEYLLGLKLGIADFRCAALQVSPYTASSIEPIKLSAEGAVFVFERLMDLNGQSVIHWKTVLNSAANGGAEIGTIAERTAELSALYDETWKELVPAAIIGTYAVVEQDPKTGLMSRLALTASQRDEILYKLRSTFGDKITHGIQTGQFSLTAAAASVYQVIGIQKRIPRGE